MTFPDLSAAKVISLDTETCDPELEEKGPGVRRGGFIAGISVAVPDGQSWYLPMRHQGGGNLPVDRVIEWAKDNLTREHQQKVGANLLYDLDFLAEEGVHVKGPLYDIQIGEPLIDENQFTFGLEAQAQKYLGKGKLSDDIIAACVKRFGGKHSPKQLSNIWRLPSWEVEPYARRDAILPIEIMEKQLPLLAEQGLNAVLDIELRLIPLLLAMRRRGVRVDVGRAQEVNHELTKRIMRDQHRINSMAGREVNIDSAADLSVLFDKQGKSYPLTAKTKKPSFTRPWLEAQHDDLCQLIVELRKWNKFRTTFIQGYILNGHINGRIHAEFNQLKTDDYGTVSGRFSSSRPNLQNIPMRDEELGPMVRSLFIPEPGELWAKFDWSQIEYRLLLHYAQGDTADMAKRLYRENPKTDFHDMTAQLTGLERRPAKTINFGLVYGMGQDKLAYQMGRTKEAARAIFDTYHGKFPFVRELFDRSARVAEVRGYIKTLLGRRRRFSLYEPTWRDRSKEQPAMPYDKALEAYGTRIKRAMTHKTLNSILQGSAADLAKKAMVQMLDSGVFDIIGVPLLTVHDEFDFSFEDKAEVREALLEVKHLMEHVFELEVPVIADLEIGPNWGSVE